MFSNSGILKYKYANSNDNPLVMNISSSIVGNSSDPSIFGPPFWFVLHNGIHSYPKSPTPFIRNSMKQLLMNLPLLVPCINCKEHFYDFLRHSNLDEAVMSRESLFAFFVRIHNYVNRRYGKPEMSLSDAKKLYGFDSVTGPTIRINYI